VNVAAKAEYKNKRTVWDEKEGMRVLNGTSKC
jgi:hypothetical protein